MSLVQVAGYNVLTGTVLMPLVGTWTADLTVDNVDGTGLGAGTQVTITCGDGGFSLAGTIDGERTGDFLETTYVRVVGGADGMGKTMQRRAFAQPSAFVNDVLNGIAADTGETISGTSDAALLSTNLVAWMTTPRTGADALKILIDIAAPGYSWRLIEDGTLWVGQETWPASSVEFILLDQDPNGGWFDLGADVPGILPGVSLDGVGNVNRVQHTIEGGSIRSRVWVDLTSDRGLPAMLDDAVDSRIGHVDYHALYECQVTAQSADLSTVDVDPVPPADKTIIGTQRVQVRAGAGVKVQFALGSKVLLGWANGNPQFPYIALGLTSDAPLAQTMSDASNDAVAIGPAGVKVNISGATWINAQPASLTLGTNPAATPVLTLGSIDSMGVPVTNSPTNTGTVLAG